MRAARFVVSFAARRPLAVKLASTTQVIMAFLLGFVRITGRDVARASTSSATFALRLAFVSCGTNATAKVSRKLVSNVVRYDPLLDSTTLKPWGPRAEKSHLMWTYLMNASITPAVAACISSRDVSVIHRRTLNQYRRTSLKPFAPRLLPLPSAKLPLSATPDWLDPSDPNRKLHWCVNRTHRGPSARVSRS